MSSKARSSAVTHGKEPAKKSSSPVIEPISILSLPHILLLDILSRVSRLDYPTLSLVSKKFRSMVASPELYETQSLLNRTEKCLYLSLHCSFNPKSIWFTIRRRTLTNKKSDYLMVQIPSPNHLLLPVKSSSLVAVGSNIYKIGGSDDLYGEKFWKPNYSSSVSVLDCRTHTWKQAPSMTMERNSASTSSVVDGKIYVAGGCKDKCVSYPNWIEVFDPKTKTWENVKNPRIFRLHEEYRNKGFIAKSFEIDGKLYMFGDDGAVYNPKEGTWNEIGENRPMFWAVRDSYCVVDDVLFYCDQGVFKWYDLKVSLWKELKGVEGLPDFRDQKICKMVDLGGKMAVLWEKCECTHSDYHEYNIWCAEIALERRDGDEILGKVEWFDLMLTIPGQGDYLPTWFDALSASL